MPDIWPGSRGTPKKLYRPSPSGYAYLMNFDDQLQRYFGTTDIASIPPQAFAPAIERMNVDLGLEKDRGRRFALWTLLHMFGAAPDLEIAFPDLQDREAARNFMVVASRADEIDQSGT